MRLLFRVLSVLLTALMVVSTVSHAQVPDSGYVRPALSVLIDGKRLEWDPSGPLPYIDPVTNRTLVPLRKILEAGGVQIDWDQTTKTAVVFNGVHLVLVPVGTNYMFWDGELITVDQGGVLRCLDSRETNCHTYVPIRHVVEKLGGTVLYSQDTNTVSVSLPLTAADAHRAQSCHTRGYGRGHNLWDCPAAKFFYPEVYGSFGVPMAVELSLAGLASEPQVVAYLNKIAVDKGGRPPNSVEEAITAGLVDWLETIAVVATAGMAYEVVAASGAVRLATQSYGAITTPDGPVRLTRSMPLNSAQYQGRITGTAPRHLGGNLWEVDEFQLNKVRFDGVRGRALLEAKGGDYAKMITKEGQLRPFNIRTELIDEANRQLAAINGTDYTIQWHFQNQRFMAAVMDMFRQHNPSVLETIEFILTP